MFSFTGPAKFLESRSLLTTIRKPTIPAVNGCEVSLASLSSLLPHKSRTNPFPMPLFPHAGPSRGVHSTPEARILIPIHYPTVRRWVRARAHVRHHPRLAHCDVRPAQSSASQRLAHAIGSRAGSPSWSQRARRNPSVVSIRLRTEEAAPTGPRHGVGLDVRYNHHIQQPIAMQAGFVDDSKLLRQRQKLS